MGELTWGTPEDELRHRLAASYRLVRSSLTKNAQAELEPFDQAEPAPSPAAPQPRKRR